MKTPTKQTSHRLAAAFAIACAFATTGALAATNVDWGGGSGGTEASPLDVYDLSNWSGVSALSDAYDLTFDACNVPTVLTNSCATAATTKIANGFKLKYGTWTLLGDYKFSSIDANNSGTEPKVATIVKKGDWELTYAAYLGRSGATTIVTNVSGNIVQSGTSWFQIGNGNGGTAIVENLSGDWTIKGALELGYGAGSRGELYWRGGNLTQTYTANAFSLGWGDNTSAVVEKYVGDWTTTDMMIVAKGNNSTASFKHNGGDLNVDGDFYCSYASNSVATVEKNGGDWTLGKSLYLGWGGKNVNSSALTTFYHNGGKMDVATNLDVTYYGSCDFYMNGGEVTVGNQVRFGTWILKNGWHHATVNLNGGILSAKGFYLHNSDDAKLSKVVFDGGTFKATASGYLVSGADARYDIADNTKLSALRARVGIDVGPKGGTIDTAGHDITNVVNFTRTSGSGGMRFVGGGSVVLTGTIGYTGKTSVEVGTTLEVTDASAKSTILNSRGLDVVGFASAGNYTVFTYEGGLDAETDLAKVTCSFAPDSTFAVVGNSIVCHYVPQAIEGNRWTGAANDGNLSTAGNWSDNQVPTSGNALIASSKPVTLTAGATFKPDTITIPDYSAVVTLADSLTLNTLTNAQRLAVAPTGSLTVDGDIVVCDGKGTFLNSNEGTVTVSGNAVCKSGTTAKQYDVVTANTNPMRVGGFVFHRDAGRAYFRLESNSAGPGAWVVGANGFRYQSDIQYSELQWRYFAQANPVTLYSSANWTLRNSGRNGTTKGDLNVFSNSSLTIDTSDYDNPALPHTVTLEGRIMAEGPVTVTGCGTLEIATTGSHESLAEDYKHTYITNGVTLAVTDTATLKVNAGKAIKGAGTISLAAGTTLVLTATSKDFTPCIDPSLALPTEGTAKIRIDGARLSSGDHTILSNVTAGATANVNLDMTSAALDGRKASLAVDGSNLVLTIVSPGLSVFVR